MSVRHDVSPPLRQLALMAKPGPAGPPREIPNQELKKVPAAPPALSRDPLVGPVPPGAPMPAPIITFDGPDDDDNQTIVGFRVAPPDSNGDVGPTHYVQFVNLILEIFNKNTGASVLGPVPGNTPWAGFPGVCGTTNDGDPIAIYDQFTGRWLLSQFAINSGVQCFAVSTTSDPTGTYNRYEFDVSPGANDYPKIGVWADGYYMMFHEFNPGFVGTRVLSFEKDKMIQGLPAQFIKFVLTPPAGETWFTVQPPHIEGIAGPPAGSPAPFVMQYDDEDWGGSPPNPTSDYVKVWKFHSDWVTPGSSTFTGPTNLPVPEYDDNMCNFARACIPQQGGELVDALSSFTMYRQVYRNFGDHQAVFTAETVDAGGDHAAIRWTEIRDPLGTPTVFQTGTHAPDALHRWVPSIAADKDGNIAIGYSVSSSTMNPAIRYAGRLAGDPLGTLPQTEASLHEGTGVQTSGANRWGDYTSLSIDEADDCTFWYTNQYYQTSGSFDWDMRIGSFKFSSCTQGPTGTLAGTVVSSPGGNPIEGVNVSLNGTYSTTTNASGQYSITVPIGTYDVTASKFGYASQTVNGVVISDGQTTTQDFALVGVASIVVDGYVTDGSGAGFPLYADVTVTSPGGTVELYTDPQTGYYSFSALVSTAYTITVDAEIAGYNPATRAIVTSNTDQQENFQLTVNQATCNAPGYSVKTIGTAITADFTAGIPAGWVVTNNTINCTAGPTWNTNNFGGRGNLTGGSGVFAIADSDRCGSTVQYDSNLVSPVLDLTGFSGSMRVEFNSDYNDLCTPSQADYVAVEYTTNGTTWTPLSVFCGPNGGGSRRGPRLESFVTAGANGSATVQIRWRYKGRWDWWWEVDNVNISRSACTFDGGGLIYGNVTDLNTGLALNGASVSLDTGQATTTEATPDDPNVGDGFYLLYAPLNGNAPGVRTMTVSKSNYGPIVRQVVPIPNGARNENFALPAGLLSGSPDAIRKRVAIGGTDTGTLTLTNTGTLDANVNLLELNSPPTNRPAGPFQQPVIPFTSNTKEDFYASIARNSRNVPGALTRVHPIFPNAGEYVNSWTASSLELPWGAGFDFTGAKLWLSSPGVFFGGSNRDWQFTLDGTETGLVFPTDSAGGSWAADMAYVGLTNTLWQVNVGGDNCIFEFDAAGTITGNKICPAFGTSMRGLAYDQGTQHFYAGTWNGNFITEFDTSGGVVRTVNVGLSVSGLAFNPNTNHLFVQVNAATQNVYILDAAQASLPVLGQFVIQNSSGGNAFAAFDGAGLELDCSGNLVAVNQNSKTVYFAASGESGACSVDIPWLSEDPTSGTVTANGGTWSSTLTFDSAGQTPGCQEAQLLATNDTPYGTLNFTTAITVAFNDVPAGSFGDKFIHAIAGAGISFGCGAGNFCPNDVMTRRLMSVWLLRGQYGRFYQPPPAVGIFADVSPESFAADWVEDLYNRGITGGCATNPLRYCPEDGVTRAAMAVFLLRTRDGSSYTPPACQGIFAHLPCSSFFAPWAEELYNRGITSGCASDPLRYCPTTVTTRSQQAIFEARTFGIPQCGQ